MHEVFIYNILRNSSFVNEQFIYYAQNDDCVKFDVIAIKKRKNYLTLTSLDFLTSLN